ncbi:MAG TPA: hypothetical protein VJ396_07055 [Acidiferrobacterales bacterium]|nr:hypothetical protein [Acidiferrobacterales bacterium]
MSAQPITETNIHNARVLDSLQAAAKAAETLARSGFTVCGAEVGGRNPVVWVRHTPECSALPSGYAVLLPGGDAIMAASVHDVQVQWIKRRSAS